ncbi:MAG: alpha/beta hydrolase [Chryseotalea sp. WA131a]|jgi:pimeloyl-ACP methyl ester carboxylesterase|nr:MAG: alpha/beta hydrolase [Chryseotalea sp. WA131a]
MNKILIRSIGLYLNSLALLSPNLAAKKGFELFCWPRRIKVKPHQLEFLNQADEKFTITYAGKKVQAYRWGKGAKKLLMLHGWQSHSYWWRYVINAIPKEEYTIFSLDAPGHGLSEGDFLNLPHYSGLLEEFVISQGSFHAVLSHSFGSFASIYSLHRKPDLNIGKVVVMAAPGEVEFFFTYYHKLLGLSNRTIELITNYFIKTIGKPPSYFKIKDFAATLSLPGLVIHDTEDLEAPYKNAVSMQQVWSNSQLISTTGLGHHLKSKELVEKVVAYLAN